MRSLVSRWGQAYHVIDARDNVSTYVNQITEQFAGFSLAIDLQ